MYEVKPANGMIKISSKILILVFGYLSSAIGQSDTLNVLSIDSFLKIVETHHPMAKQAELLPDKGEATVLRSRGAFDPEIFSDVSQKYFDNSQYYSHINGGLKIPTWFGIELHANYNTHQGAFLNPEKKTPSAGLWSAGISMPLGEDLFIDQRRAELRKAKIYRESTQAERRIMLNELLYEAGKAYWDWFKSYHKMRVYEMAVQIAQERLEAVIREVTVGERPGIDTLEAGIQVQNRQLNLQEAQLEFRNQSELVSVFLWAEGVVPLEVGPNTMPIAREALKNLRVDETFLDAINNLPDNHPLLQRYRYQIDQLDIDRRMKAEQLKPTLNIGYEPVAAAGDQNLISNYSINDYVWTLGFSSPLFLRKERGDLTLAKLKIQDAELDYAHKEQQLLFKANTAFNRWETTLDQIELYERTVSDYERLLEGERQMFEAGESSLFMVNSRESNFINARIQLIDLQTQNQKAGLEARFALGTLNE